MVTPQPHEPGQRREENGDPGESTADRRAEVDPDSAEERPQRWGFGAFLAVEATLLASAAFVSVLLDVPRGEPIPVWAVLIGTMAPTMIAAGLALLITIWRGNGPCLDLRLFWRRDDLRTGLRFGLLGLVVATVGAFVWTRIVGPQDATSAIAALIEDKPMSELTAVALFVYIWLLAPIFEEIIYRGVLWRAVERLNWASQRWARMAAFLITTGVFAASHLEPLRTTLLIVIAIPIGLARLVTGRLLASIVAHQVNNFLPGVAILLAGLGVISW